MRRLLTVLLAGLAILLGVSGPALAAPTVTVKPGSLDRGTDLRLPYVDGTTIVDGATRIDVDAPSVQMLGRAGRGWAVLTSRSDGYLQPRVLRVKPDGSTKVLARAADLGGLEFSLSSDGTRLIRTKASADFARTQIRVLSAFTGKRIAERVATGAIRVLDATSGQVLSARSAAPYATQLWELGSGRVRVVSRTYGYSGSLSEGLLASYTKDPYDGGCTWLSTLADPGTPLWRSCKERVVAFAPGGRRVATVDLLSDGVGPAYVGLRKVSGGIVAGYRAQAYFTDVRFESARSLALGAASRSQFAWVRCTGATCERASDLTDAPYRIAPALRSPAAR